MKGALILLVEDEVQVRKVFASYLERGGYHVLQAATGEEALEAARRTRPDLVFSDVLMPGMDGYELVRRLHGELLPPVVPVVLCSGYFTDEAAMQLAKDYGVLMLDKPSSEQAILSAVAETLQRPGGHPFALTEHIEREHNRVLVDKLSEKIAESAQANEMLNESTRQLRALLARLHRAQEEERILVSREIHDELGQLLTGLKMDVRWLERKLSSPGLPPGLNPLLERAVAASDLTDATITAVQRIATQLRPQALDKLGLGAALMEEARQYQERAGIRCRVEVTKPFPAVSTELANELFYICREALTNVARHAQATEVEIRLTSEAGAVVLKVCDNGVGMSAAQMSAADSLGLIGMRERAMQCGATIAFARNGKRGTRVTVRVTGRVRGIGDG